MKLGAKSVAFRCIVAGTVLLASFSRHAAAQDTLSDAAWKADVARRAVLRHAAEAKAQAQRDSTALLVDTIEVSPVEVAVHVGDTISIPELLRRLKAVGKGRDGQVVAGFHPTYLFPMSNSAMAIRQGQIVVTGFGEALVRARAKPSTGPYDDSRPTTSIRIVARP
jgi:hypothetical protein